MTSILLHFHFPFLFRSIVYFGSPTCVWSVVSFSAQEQKPRFLCLFTFLTFSVFPIFSFIFPPYFQLEAAHFTALALLPSCYHLVRLRSASLSLSLSWCFVLNSEVEDFVLFVGSCLFLEDVIERKKALRLLRCVGEEGYDTFCRTFIKSNSTMMNKVQVSLPRIGNYRPRTMDYVSEFSPFMSLAAALSYGIASMAMVFINKAVLMQYTHSMTLLTFQQLATTLLIHFGRVFGFTKSKGLNLRTAKKLLPLSLFYNANVAFALASLKGVNIPMYIALKRLTPLAVLVAGFFTGKGRPPIQVSLSVLLTGVGVIIAALGDFSFDLFGYTMALSSVFFQTMYLLLVERSGAEDGLSSIELMFYNGILSLPFLISLIIATGEFPHSLAVLYEKVDSFYFSIILVLSVFMGIVLNFTMFLCTIVNSALTTTIVGVLKGVGSNTLGFVVLGGVSVHALNVTGLVINTAGGIWYSYAKYQQKKSRPRTTSSDVESNHR